MFNQYDTLEEANHTQPRVTALLVSQENLMPLSWHMPISKSPFRYAVAVRQENYTHQLLQKHQSFTLNFLPFEYYEEVSLMGKSHGNEVDKLTQSELETLGKDDEGNLLLGASDFIYEARVCDSYQNGDHTIFISDIVKIHVNEKQSQHPMLFAGRGRYATIETWVNVKK